MATYQTGNQWIINVHLSEPWQVESLLQSDYPELAGDPVTKLPVSYDIFEAWCNANGYQGVTDSEPETVNLDRLHQAIEAYDRAVKPAQAVEASEDSPF